MTIEKLWCIMIFLEPLRLVKKGVFSYMDMVGYGKHFGGKSYVHMYKIKG